VNRLSGKIDTLGAVYARSLKAGFPGLSALLTSVRPIFPTDDYGLPGFQFPPDRSKVRPRRWRSMLKKLLTDGAVLAGSRPPPMPSGETNRGNHGGGAARLPFPSSSGNRGESGERSSGRLSDTSLKLRCRRDRAVFHRHAGGRYAGGPPSTPLKATKHGLCEDKFEVIPAAGRAIRA